MVALGRNNLLCHEPGNIVFWILLLFIQIDDIEAIGF